jgi:hypothetical protein
MTEYQQWVSGLKVGDEVYVFSKDGINRYDSYVKLVVTAVTRWTVTCRDTRPGRENHVTHYRRAGSGAGRHLAGKDLLAKKDEDRIAKIDAEQYQRQLVREIQTAKLEELDTATLEQIKVLVQKRF